MSDLRVPDLNRVIIAGRLTRDPDLKFTQNGNAYCRLGVANTRYYKSQDGERREDTVFIDAVVWGKQAEYVGEKLKKGRPVLIEGSLSQSEWEDRETGQKRSKIELNAQRVTPLDWDGDGVSGGAADGGERKPTPEDDIPF